VAIGPWEAKADTAVRAELEATQVRAVTVELAAVVELVDKGLQILIQVTPSLPELAVMEVTAAKVVMAAQAAAVRPAGPAGMGGPPMGAVCTSPADRSPCWPIVSLVIPPSVAGGPLEALGVPVYPAAEVGLGVPAAAAVMAGLSLKGWEALPASALPVLQGVRAAMVQRVRKVSALSAEPAGTEDPEAEAVCISRAAP